jgi:hypothetical protein
VIFTAYFDEANTHGPAPTTIMSTLLGHADQWCKFNDGLNGLRSRYGFNMFHAKQFQARRGEFVGWDNAKWSRLLVELTELATKTLTERATVHFERNRYLEEYRNQPFPSKMQPDSQYGLCFRMLLLHLLRFMCEPIERATNFDEVSILNLVVEDGHKYVGAVRTIFGEIQRRLVRHGAPLLGSVTIAKKRECTELMAADFVAHTYLLMRRAVFGNETLVGQFDYDDSPNESVLSSIEFGPVAFSAFKTEYERDKQEKMDEWRRRRDAKRSPLE